MNKMLSMIKITHMSVGTFIQYCTLYNYAYVYLHVYVCMRETKTPRVQKKGEAKKNQRLKALISNKAKKSVNESVT